MKKDDWIEILNSLNNKDWTDWVIISVSIISPILVLISVFYSAKAANAAKNAADLNLKMYNEQKAERERSFQPIFKILDFSVDKKELYVTLSNYNTEKKILLTRVIEDDDKNTWGETNENTFWFHLYDDFEKKDSYRIFLYYTTLDHRHYHSEIKFKIILDHLRIQEHIITNLD